MQIGYTHSPSLYVDEPIMSSGTGTISAIERNGRLVERLPFSNATDMRVAWVYLWIMHGKPAGHPDRPYIVIKRDTTNA